MAEPVDSDQLPTSEEPQNRPENWVKVGAVAALSAIAGGLAAAWWYRRTLTKLRDADNDPPVAPLATEEDEF
jgi:hypothetical protein